MTKEKLPIEVHDHFRKANILNGYVVKSLSTARDHALEAGQELMAAKAGCPPKSWEKECVRLFDGSLRTAQCYMAFARDFGKLKSAGQSALLMLEGSLEGAAKAAKAAAKPKPPTPEPTETIDVESSPPTPAQVQEGVASVMAEDEPAGKKPAKPKPPAKVLSDSEQQASDTKYQIGIWRDAVGRWMVSIDKYRADYPGKQGDLVIKLAKQFYESLGNWQRGVK